MFSDSAAYGLGDVSGGTSIQLRRRGEGFFWGHNDLKVKFSL